MIYIYINIVFMVMVFIHQLISGGCPTLKIYTKDIQKFHSYGSSVRTAHGRHQEVTVVLRDAQSLVPRSRIMALDMVRTPNPSDSHHFPYEHITSYNHLVVYCQFSDKPKMKKKLLLWGFSLILTANHHL